MSDSLSNADSSDSDWLRRWNRIPVVVRAVVIGFLVNTIGVGTWVAVLMLVPAPWSMAVMLGLLWAYWKYFSGSWWPATTSTARRWRFRATSLTKPVWAWGLLTSLLLVAIVQSTLVVTFRFTEFPHDLFTAEYNFDEIPTAMAWMFIVVASLVAGICEETGFRGYMQTPLEKRYGPGLAIAVTSVVFVIAHVHQAWATPVLLHIFVLSALFGILAYASGSLILPMIAHTIMDIFNFSYWWSDVAGRFEYLPISETGIDGHFVRWCLILAVSAALFFWGAGRTAQSRRVTPVSS